MIRLRTFLDSKAGLACLLIMLMWAGSYISQTVYRAIRADITASMTQAMAAQPQPEYDFVAACLAYAVRNGMDDAACRPFADAQWSDMTGGRPPAGDPEGMAEWQYNSSPEGTFLIGPGRLRVWVPTDLTLCPQVITAGASEGACPTWVPNE